MWGHCNTYLDSLKSSADNSWQEEMVISVIRESWILVDGGHAFLSAVPRLIRHPANMACRLIRLAAFLEVLPLLRDGTGGCGVG